MPDKEKNIQKLLNLSKDDTRLDPPCCNEYVLDLFSSYFHLWMPQCSNSDSFLKDVINKIPKLSENEATYLKEYLSEAHQYLLDICCTFVGIVQNYGGSRKDYGPNQKYCDILIQTCLKKYNWLTEDYLYDNLWQICRLCNW